MLISDTSHPWNEVFAKADDTFSKHADSITGIAIVALTDDGENPFLAAWENMTSFDLMNAGNALHLIGMRASMEDDDTEDEDDGTPDETV